MASGFSIDVASSLVSRSLVWPRCTLTTLTRAAWRRCHSDRSLTALATRHQIPQAVTRLRQAQAHSSCDTHGWNMVLVLNELLDVTASRQYQWLRSAQLGKDRYQGAATRSRCINCQRNFSLVRDAASLPQRGFCSADCRASHDYMDAIDTGLGSTFKKPSLCSSTIDSSFSSCDPASTSAHLTPPLRARP